jgi:hypothetical protein
MEIIQFSAQSHLPVGVEAGINLTQALKEMVQMVDLVVEVLVPVYLLLEHLVVVMGILQLFLHLKEMTEEMLLPLQLTEEQVVVAQMLLAATMSHLPLAVVLVVLAQRHLFLGHPSLMPVVEEVGHPLVQ